MKIKLRGVNDISPDHFKQFFKRGLATLLVLCSFQFLVKAQAPTCGSYGDGDATNVVFRVNGSVVPDLNSVSSGDQLEVCFDVTAGSTPTIFTLVSYKAPAATFNAADADLQTIFDMDSQTFTGSGCLSITVPSCFFQVDFVRGCAITQFGSAGSSGFYGAQGRLIAGVNGGVGTCGCVANADAGADLTLSCGSASATINASTYTHNPVINWQAVAGGSITAGAGTLNPTVNATGMYVLTVTDTLNCSVVDTVVVAGGGSLSVDLGADINVCAGASVMLNAGNPGATFSWSTGASTQMINVTASGTYYVTVTDGSCTASDTINVTVSPAMTVNLGADITASACGGSITLDAGNSGMGFMWNTGASTQTISVNASGSYYVTVSNGSCSVSDTINVTVNPGMLNVDLGADITLCAGANVMLDAGNAGSGFLWSTGASTQMISVNTSGSVYVTVTNGSCSVSDTVNVTVLPALNVNLGADISSTVCAGPVMLDAGNSGMLYLWSTGAISQTIGVTASGMYTVTVTNSGGCSMSDSINVTLTPPTISVDLGIDAVVCAGGSLMLDAGNAGLSFSWSTGASTQMISVNTSGTYYVTVTDGSCSVSDTINVVVLPALNVDLGNDTTVVFCAGSVMIDAGNPGMTYLWNTGAVSQTIGATASGTYYVTVTNVGGCTATDSINITVNPGSLSINIGNDTSYLTCSHETLMLDAGVAGGVYAWSTGLTTQTLEVSASGTYYVNVTDNLGCMASDTINVNIIDNTVDLNLGPDTVVCGCISLNAGVTGATSYLWCSGQTYPSINVCNTGVYCVTVGNGTCVSTDTISVTMNTAPVVYLGMDTTVVGVGAMVTLDAGNVGMSYMWSTGATTQTITVTASGTYYVTVTDMYGCTGTDSIVVNFPIGIAENTMGVFHVDVFPNPSTGSDLTLNFNVAENENVEIRIMNVLGRVIYTETLQNFKGVYNKKLPLEDLSGGIYFANVQKGKSTSVAKFTVH